MNKVISFSKNIVVQLLLVVMFLGAVKFYFDFRDHHIISDGVGYYDHLPALFIHHDLHRKDKPLSTEPQAYERVQALGVPGGYVPYKDRMVNKYAVGTSVLQSPFFLATYSFQKLKGEVGNGYELVYQKTVFWSTIFYLFIALIFLRKLLRLYDVNSWVIVFLQLVLVFATPVTHYANAEAAFSHIYSLFAITAFLYFARLALTTYGSRALILAGLFFGLTVIIRQVNLLVILLVPFLAGSLEGLISALYHWLSHWKTLLTSIAVGLAVVSLQLITWYLQTGDWVVYSYQGETFNFSDPHFIDILFSYRKGLFVYTPVLLLSLIGVANWLIRGKQFLAMTWLLFFLTITYVLSSWSSWYFGCSFGLRAYIDHFAVFFIPMGVLLTNVKWIFKLPLMLAAFLCIPLNVIQTVQYREYILHWIDMDKEKYWNVFLETETRFKGLVWKENLNLNNYEVVHEANLGRIMVPQQPASIAKELSSSDIPNFESVSAVQIELYNNFDRENDLDVVLEINDTEPRANRHWAHRHLIQFADNELGKPQLGQYGFAFQNMPDSTDKTVVLFLSQATFPTQLDSVKMRFLKAK